MREGSRTPILKRDCTGLGQTLINREKSKLTLMKMFQGNGRSRSQK